MKNWTESVKAHQFMPIDLHSRTCLFASGAVTSLISCVAGGGRKSTKIPLLGAQVAVDRLDDIGS